MYNSQVFQETFRMSVAFKREDVAYGKPHKGQKSTIVTAVAQFSDVVLMLFGKSLFFQDWKVASLTKYLEGRYPGYGQGDDREQRLILGPYNYWGCEVRRMMNRSFLHPHSSTDFGWPIFNRYCLMSWILEGSVWWMSKHLDIVK